MQTLADTLIYRKYGDDLKRLYDADYGSKSSATDQMMIHRALLHFLVERLSDLESRLSALEK